MVGSVSANAVVQGKIETPAIIGKLPGHGDFLARGVEYGLREPLDRWMSEWIELSRAHLGEDFEPSYESAAPWLFEGNASHAVFMPSVDSVGRLFPILAICSASVRTQDIYDALITALEGSAKADSLVEELGELASEDTSLESEASASWFLPQGAEQKLPSPTAADSWPMIREHFA